MSSGSLVELTPAAADKVIELGAGEPDRAYLHVYPAGQGCCRTAYGLAFLRDAGDDFEVAESHGVKVAVATTALETVQGVEIDFVQTPDGDGFTIINRTPGTGGGCAGG